MLALGCLPLMVVDLRLRLSATITCSDASELGNGVCVSGELTKAGRRALGGLRGPAALRAVGAGGLLVFSLFDGIGGLHRSLDAAGIAIEGYVAAEKDARCRRLVGKHFPRAICVDDVKLIDLEFMVDIKRRYSRVGAVLISGGFPCQQFSKLNLSRAGLASQGGQLVHHLPRLAALARTVFSGCVVHLFGECTKMDDAQMAEVNGILNVVPVFIEASNLLWCRRPRCYWISWDLQEAEGVTITPGHRSHRVALEGRRISVDSWLSRGWRLSDTFDGAFNTFTRAIPEKVAGHKLIGLEKLNDKELQVWKDEGHRFAPYQYQSKLLLSRGDRKRSLNAQEREIIMGFPPGFTLAALERTKRSGQEAEDARCALIGNSWAVPVTTWLVGQLGLVLGLLPTAPSPGQCVQRCAGVAEMAADEGGTPTDMARELLRHVNHTGAELRKDPHTNEHPHVWPRRSLDPRWWRWRVVVSHRWAATEDHINKLELRSYLAALRWRARIPSRLHSKVFHLTDSAVCIGVVSRARSSSFHLQLVADKINSVILAARFRVISVHVATKLNPADAPSRRVLTLKRSTGLVKAWQGASLPEPR